MRERQTEIESETRRLISISLRPLGIIAVRHGL